MDAIRYLVSGKRRRFRDEHFDLDLTYISSRLIAMGLPSVGLEAIYRNPLEEVARFLKFRHAGNFMIFNLSERRYNYDMFEGRIIETGWPDHHTAPIAWIVDIAKGIDGWLSSSPEHVAVIHCLAGKGRTGVAVAAYLLYSGAVLSPDWDVKQYDEGADDIETPALLQRVYDAADEGDGDAEDDVDDGSSRVQGTDDGSSLPAQTGAPVSTGEANTLPARSKSLFINGGSSVDAQFPSAAEIGARAILAFVRTRGDGLNFAAQRRSVRYMALLCRTAVVKSLEAAATELKEALSAIGTGGAAAMLSSSTGLATAPLELDFSLALSALADLQVSRPPTVILYTVVLHGVPGIKADESMGNGCSPSIQLRSLPYQGADDGSGDAAFDSAWSAPNGLVPSFTRDDTAVVIPMNASIKGDVLLRCMHHAKPGSGKAPVELFRYTFHTAFMEMGQVNGRNVHRVFAGELDMDKRKRNRQRLPQGFHMDLLYEFAGKGEAPAGETAGGGRGQVGDGGVVVHGQVASSPEGKAHAYEALGADSQDLQQVLLDGDGTVASEREVNVEVDQLELGGASV